MSGGPAAVLSVMLCDDSATVRNALARLLESDPAIRVTLRAGHGAEAVAARARLPAAERPQVILLDLEMPVMDGMTALPLLLRQAPRPAVIVASALTQRGAATAMAALRAGAVDYIPKPDAAGGGLADPGFRAEVLAKVRGWARVGRIAVPAAAGARTEPAMAPRRRVQAIGIGSSTGGPAALAALLQGLDRPPPVPLLVTQHMPARFTGMLADHLDRLGQLPCAEARDGEALRPGRLYLAPGDRHLLAERGGAGLVARLSDAPAENFCRPAVDPMLRSLATACGGAVLAVILTGMGQDGLAGCRAVAHVGGLVMAQDEASSVVWGMPGAIARAGLACGLLPPAGLAAQMLAACGARTGHAA